VENDSDGKGEEGLPYNHMPINMFCGWDVLYLLHQPAFSWDVSRQPQKTSTKEAVFQQFEPRSP
jgi:hypothetical protein